MKIKMRTTCSGPQGTFHAGEVADVAEDFGATLVAGGFALEMKASRAAETSMRKTPEATVARQQGKRQ